MACVEACPEKVIVAEGDRVSVNFSENGCSFCQACAEICKEPVFASAEMRQMSNPWHGAAKISTACLTLSGVVCQSCGDFCDQSAIRFSPNSNAIATPAILEDRCTGCGYCLASCPADAISIDFVIGAGAPITLTAEAI
jgi:ferredoxin-type protein NapF